MKTKDFSYKLPKRLIAQRPPKQRLDSRLLVLDRKTGDITHTMFKRFHDHLREGDVLVLNDTAVLPARLIGRKEETGAVIEALMLREVDTDHWECLVKKAKKVKKGTRLSFGEDLLTMTCTEEREEGLRIFRLDYEGILFEILDKLGEMPLPPYIHETLEDPDRYQTVYRKKKGSAAAPTAGLHFTKEYLNLLRSRNVEIATITLHVGLGTFRPVSVENVEEHKMHEEYYTVDEKAAAAINKAKREGRRVIPVGTTSMRTLETIADGAGCVRAQSGMSDLFIYPGYRFKVADALLTNFHLPESTLLMLVSAFSSREIVLNAYREAVAEEYRFFSFGDAMFLK